MVPIMCVHATEGASHSGMCVALFINNLFTGHYCILRGRIKGFNSAIHAIRCQQVVIELWLGSYRTIE